MKIQMKVFLTKLKIYRVPLLVVLCICLGNNTTYAQIKTISGTITDEIDAPLPGATIVEKGTKNGVTSDFDGNYSIQATEGATLVISFIGYKTLEIIVSGQTTLDLQLEPDFNQLEEAVVIGYGSVQKKDLTGSVASVKMDQLTDAPVANFQQALGGRVTGVQVSSGTGEPGEGLSITIRGANTVNGDNDPLYVLDGFIVDDFNPNIIDQSDIKSIDILKDASATAIYGARGANGVILITSKQAKIGKTKISYETRLDVKEVSNKMPVLDAYEYIQYAYEVNPGRTSAAYFEDIDGNVVGGVEDYKDEPTRNWQDEAFRTAYAKSHKFNISSGGEKTRFTASLNGINDEGTLIETDYKRVNGRLNLNHKVNDKFDVTMDLIYSNDEQTGLDTKGTGTYSFLRNLISYANVDNKFIDYPEGQSPLDGTTEAFQADPLFNWHPIQSLENEYRKRRNDRFISNVSLRWKFHKNLTLDVRGGYNALKRKNETFNNSKTVYGRLIQPINGINGSIDYRNYSTLTNINTLTFKKTFADKHYINAMIGTSIIAKREDRTFYRGNFIPEYIESTGINALDEGQLANTDDINGGFDERTQSVLSRLNYTFDNKYLLTASLRRDGSSKFGPGHNVAYFPSVGLAWKAEEEEFIQNIDWVSQLKIKVGYGKTGNDRIPAGARFDNFTSIQSSYFIDNGNVELGQRPPSTGSNELLEWETTAMYNAGLDLGFFNGRISTTIEVYEKTTDDLLLLADTPPSLGVSQVWVNSGDVRNRGLEIALHTTNFRTDDFRWTTDFNISFNKNEVLSLPVGKPIFGKPNYYSRYAVNQFIVEEGQPLGNMFGYLSDGLYQPADFDTYDPDNATNNVLASGQPDYTGVRQPGDAKYKDLNGDGQITPDDKTVIGNGLPKHFGGFANNFSYKNFDLSIFFEWSYGNDILNANRLVFEEMEQAGQNQYATVTNRWTPDNQDTDMYRAGGRGLEDISSRIVEDGSYMRLKTINFSYSFAQDVLEKLPISSLKFFASAQNLVTWTDYSGFNPDVSTNRSPIMPGIDYSGYPISKIYSLGLNLTF